ncbi:RraA family protein [Rhodococcus sp. IEGM 248]|uniref:4-carboxy-4-hydroxy-2-oxoadipate aldolase/oxaloacetate decarboxylase n=1 Tax=Rhodococcus opacus TaxID=37919 RepID=UPI0013BF2CB5|nr:4-carboxy-4-hydroxy-2-oxoadipate aldolase/oxaloacetate decarboxylase [Rhodococcus opacus]MDV7090316.1 4-carboxy-4-hydroxy-2-oxoadipate aldolase/oxaloacetate decarboxylase [Rhodococcus opacus]NDV06667.1 RraA family protein [Rhodococcus sp. IEGM 248]
MTDRPTAEQLTRLRELGAATIYEAQGQRGSIDARITPIDPTMKLAGPALTVDAGPGDNLMLHAALQHARPGDILVADAKGFADAGAWGDVLTAAALEVGIAGLIINGAVRDAEAITTMGFPVFAKGLSIRGTTKTYKGTIGKPVDIAGTVVHNGDIIVGDRDGVVVIHADQLDQSLHLAQEREHKESTFRKQIANGVTTVELLGLTPTLHAYFPN